MNSQSFWYQKSWPSCYCVWKKMMVYKYMFYRKKATEGQHQYQQIEALLVLLESSELFRSDKSTIWQYDNVKIEEKWAKKETTRKWNLKNLKVSLNPLSSLRGVGNTELFWPTTTTLDVGIFNNLQMSHIYLGCIFANLYRS